MPKRRWLKLLGLSLCTLLILVGAQLRASVSLAQDSWLQPGETLPSLQTHPLPTALAQWDAFDEPEDYFDQVRPTRVGYLIWSQFPVTVYVEPLVSTPSDEGRGDRWLESVNQAIQEWSAYFPLQPVTTPTADIVIQAITPALAGQGSTLRARSAEARYELYVRRPELASAQLAHRFEILLRPDQTPTYIAAAARHELGHALGIWGHSSVATDTLYFSQVRQPPTISSRDLNTLKRLYQQQTRLGWPLERSPTPNET